MPQCNHQCKNKEKSLCTRSVDKADQRCWQHQAKKNKTKKTKKAKKQKGGAGDIKVYNPHDSNMAENLPSQIVNYNNANPNPAAAGANWRHYHTPLYQNYGGYVCVKRDVLRDLGSFFKDTMTSSVGPANLS